MILVSCCCCRCWCYCYCFWHLFFITHHDVDSSGGCSLTGACVLCSVCRGALPKNTTAAPPSVHHGAKRRGFNDLRTHVEACALVLLRCVHHNALILGCRRNMVRHGGVLSSCRAYYSLTVSISVPGCFAGVDAVMFFPGAWDGRRSCDDGVDAGGDRGGPRGVLLPRRGAAQEVPRHGIYRGDVQGLGEKVTALFLFLFLLGLKSSEVIGSWRWRYCRGCEVTDEPVSAETKLT